MTDSQSVTVTTGSFTPKETSAPIFQVSNLVGETFVSKIKNAVKADSVTLTGNTFTLKLPPLSITAVALTSTTPIQIASKRFGSGVETSSYYARLSGNTLHLDAPASAGQPAFLYDLHGNKVGIWTLDGKQPNYELPVRELPNGQYLLQLPGIGIRMVAKMSHGNF